MELKLAEPHDIDDIVRLQQKYHISVVSDSDKTQGFVTTAFSREQLLELIQGEQGIFVAIEEGRVVAYLMAASWAYWSQWPVQAHMMATIERYHLNGIPITTENSYQYGPICIDGPHRGTGLLEDLFFFALHAMAARYEILVTFVNQQNARSMAAHLNKLHLQNLGEFKVNNNHYVWLACMTSQNETK